MYGTSFPFPSWRGKVDSTIFLRKYWTKRDLHIALQLKFVSKSHRLVDFEAVLWVGVLYGIEDRFEIDIVVSFQKGDERRRSASGKNLWQLCVWTHILVHLILSPSFSKILFSHVFPFFRREPVGSHSNYLSHLKSKHTKQKSRHIMTSGGTWAILNMRKRKSKIKVSHKDEETWAIHALLRRRTRRFTLRPYYTRVNYGIHTPLPLQTAQKKLLFRVWHW